MSIIESGTFQINAWMLMSVDPLAVWFPDSGPATLPNQFFNVGLTGNTRSGKFVMAPVAGVSTLSMTGGSPSPVLIEHVPPGFTPTTNLKIPASGITHLHFVNAADTETAQYGSAVATRTGVSSSPPDLPIADGTTWEILIGQLLEIDATIVGDGGFGSAVESQHGGVRITGDYVIIMFWWQIPEKDACGNEHTPRLTFAADKPGPADDGGEYERFDPDDPDAAPTPVIYAVEPDHGLTAGGTFVRIRGDGFGDGASVEFGGTVATGISVVSSKLIECFSPAHAAGDASVVVINPDGVTS